MSQLIKKTLVTEKASFLAEKGVYVFKVDRKASKTIIKKHVEKYFDVKVDNVNTVIARTKGGRTRKGVKPVRYYKKAFVKLKKNEKISLFEGN